MIEETQEANIDIDLKERTIGTIRSKVEIYLVKKHIFVDL